MKVFVQTLLAFLYRDWLFWTKDRLNLVLRFVFQPSVYILVFGGVLGAHLTFYESVSPNYGEIVGPGLIGFFMLNFAMFNVGSAISGGFYNGLIEGHLLTPVSIFGYWVVRVLSAVSNSLAMGLFALLLIWIYLGVLPENGVLLVLMLFMVALAYSFMAIIVYTLPSTPDKADRVLQFVLMPASYLGCTFYTYDMLDGGWAVAALFVPTTYFNELMRVAYNAQIPHLPFWPLLVGVFMSLLVLGLVSYRLFRRRFQEFLW